MFILQEKEEETGKGSEQTQTDLVAKDENPEETSNDDRKKEAENEDKELNELETQEPDEYNQNEKVAVYLSTLCLCIT